MFRQSVIFLTYSSVLGACTVRGTRNVLDQGCGSPWQRLCGEGLMSVFKDARHLFRFAGLFVLCGCGRVFPPLFPVFWGGAPLHCAQKLWAVWALSRGLHRRNSRSAG